MVLQRLKTMLFWPKTLAEAPKYIFDGARADLRPVFLPDFTRQPSDLWHKVLKFLFVGRIPLPPRIVAWLTGFEGWNELKRVQPTDRFMADGVTNPRTLQAIAWILPKGVRKYNYFNNCLRFALPGKDIDGLMHRMKRMGFELYTFDPDDARLYGLHLTEQFYRMPEPLDPNFNPNNSSSSKSNTLRSLPNREGGGRVLPINPNLAFFCGENKGRRADLEVLQKMLETQGLTTRFIIADRPADRIPYSEYLRHLAACQYLVDWVQADQAGITRRPIEALFWQKKLITNHRALLQTDFYRPENIFIVGYDAPARLSEFLNSPLVPVPDDVKYRYHVDHWLQYFEL